MRIKFFFVLPFLFGMTVSIFAQINLTGVVIDTETKAPLQFANIGIRYKNIGTRSLTDGTFSIKIPEQNKSDTLTFSMVGYTQLKVSIQDIIESKQEIFKLKSKTLSPVVVTVNGLTEAQFGIKGDGLLNIGDGSVNQNDIFEIAQVIRLDTTLSKITSVSLYIIESKRDSATFRINFYSFSESEPGERVIEKNIVQTKPIREGWLTFDLSTYNIYLRGDVAVAIEFIPTEAKGGSIYYGIKLGGLSKSFVRSASLGAWNTPPHHYRLFVTALVKEEKRNRKDYLEEEETKPSTILFSEFVEDSFSVFVSLPEAYKKKKEKNFPVIYLLDANVYFDIIANFILENKIEAILVGVGYSDFITMDSLRNRDYTFPKAPSSDSLMVSGGANNYLAFLTRELFVHMNQNYRVDTTNITLMGHSYGGYFTLFSLYQSLLENKNYFHHYVAASPSLDYCNGYLIEKFQKISSTVHSNQLTLLMTFGEREDSEDGETGTQGRDGFNSFVTLLTAQQFKNIRCVSKVYSGFGHMQTAVPTFKEALQQMKEREKTE